jgi:hypothetical protein
MKLKKYQKLGVIMILSGLLIGSVVGVYLYNLPHRNVATAKTDYVLTAKSLVDEFLTDYAKANNKYLADNGNSKILEVTGRIQNIGENYTGNTVLELKDSAELAGVSCTLLDLSLFKPYQLKVGKTITLKGVIRSGALYDTDMELYRSAILDKCTPVSN